MYTTDIFGVARAIILVLAPLRKTLFQFGKLPKTLSVFHKLVFPQAPNHVGYPNQDNESVLLEGVEGLSIPWSAHSIYIY